ncbi:MAG: HlyD family efflux transporter periplasmic adaptor subunit, partial [Chitinophagaceae bacterium]
VEQMDLKIGMAAAPGMQSIRVVNSSNLKAKAQVAESYIGKVGQGDAVKVIFPDLQDSVSTKVSFASKVVDPSSRSFNVEVRLPSNRRYRANMIAILKVVDYTNSNAITIPVNSIQRAENGEYVLIAQNGKAKRATIKTGRTIDGKTEILSGLKVGDKLITTGVENLNEGDAVKFN